MLYCTDRDDAAEEEGDEGADGLCVEWEKGLPASGQTARPTIEELRRPQILSAIKVVRWHFGPHEPIVCGVSVMRERGGIIAVAVGIRPSTRVEVGHLEHSLLSLF